MNKKYKQSSKANSSGYRKIETDDVLLNYGFPSVGLNPVEIGNKIYIPTAYICYELINGKLKGEKE